MDQKNYLISLLGKTKKSEPTGNHVLQKEQLFAAIDDPEASGRFFCTGCGALLEVNQNGLQALCNIAGVKPDSGIKFFQVDRCIVCTDAFFEALPVD